MRSRCSRSAVSSSSFAALSRLPNAGRSAGGSLPRLFSAARQRAGSPEVARLGLLELVGVLDAREYRERLLDDGVEILHAGKTRG